MKIYELDVNGKTASFPHYWELCVGSCHAATALRADWQQQLERCHKELGFRYVRFHGLFNDDMSVVTRPMLASRPVYCFTNIDRIYDFLLSIGMKPFVEIGFMPECMASGNKTIFHYKGNTTPPRSYEEWTGFIGLFLDHLIDRYGRAEVRSWYFEIWNEPNLGGHGKRYQQTLAEGTVDVSAFYDEELHAVQLLAVNHQSLLHPIGQETVRVTLKNAPVCIAAESTCIDETHANALSAWKKMGEPVYLTPAQHLALESASCLETVSQPFLQENGTLSLNIGLEPMGMAVITLYFEK